MPKPASVLSNRFAGHVNYIDKTRLKIELLFSQKRIVRRDIERIYEGIFLDVIATFEMFIEDLFIGLLVNKINHKGKIFPKITFNSEVTARKIVFAGRNYVDWLPYNHTETRAGIFFRNGLPFTLDKPDKQILAQYLIVRNAIAHRSKHSQKTLYKEILSPLNLLSREQTAAGYLRHIFRTSPSQTIYENAVIDIVTIAKKICMLT